MVCGEMEKAAGHSGPPLFLSVQNLLLGISDSLDIVIHQMPANIAVEEPLYCRELLAVHSKKIIRAIINAKIPANRLTLDVGVVAVEIDNGTATILDSHAVSAERPCAGCVEPLQLWTISLGAL